MPKGHYNRYSGMGAPKKETTESKQPEQGKIAGDSAVTHWPTGKKSDPYSKLKATASQSKGVGVNQAKGEGSKSSGMRYGRMV